jgi:hypothetical protein
MSFAGRAESSSGCAARPVGRAIGLTGFVGQIQLSSPTGSYVMAMAEHREPYESRGSRTVLGARGGKSLRATRQNADPPLLPLTADMQSQMPTAGLVESRMGA